MNEEILSGLKGATERGFKLEESAQSFINAGYDLSEVREAVSLISRGFSPLPKSLKETTIPKDENTKPKASSKTKWVITILIILVVLGITISMLLFRDKFIGAVIDPIFP